MSVKNRIKRLERSVGVGVVTEATQPCPNCAGLFFALEREYGRGGTPLAHTSGECARLHAAIDKAYGERRIEGASCH